MDPASASCADSLQLVSGQRKRASSSDVDVGPSRTKRPFERRLDGAYTPDPATASVHYLGGDPPDLATRLPAYIRPIDLDLRITPVSLPVQDPTRAMDGTTEGPYQITDPIRLFAPAWGPPTLDYYLKSAGDRDGYAGTMEVLYKTVTCKSCYELMVNPFAICCGIVMCYQCTVIWVNQWGKCTICRRILKQVPSACPTVADMINALDKVGYLHTSKESFEEYQRKRKESKAQMERDKEEGRYFPKQLAAQRAECAGYGCDNHHELAYCQDCFSGARVSAFMQGGGYAPLGPTVANRNDREVMQNIEHALFSDVAATIPNDDPRDRDFQPGEPSDDQEEGGQEEEEEIQFEGPGRQRAAAYTGEAVLRSNV